MKIKMMDDDNKDDDDILYCNLLHWSKVQMIMKL